MVMTDTFLDETTALLARTPQVLRALLDSLPEAWLEGRDTPDGWQPRDVVGHLISAHDLDHVAQVYAALSATQDAAVGTWKAYLGILLRREDPNAFAD